MTSYIIRSASDYPNYSSTTSYSHGDIVHSGSDTYLAVFYSSTRTGLAPSKKYTLDTTKDFWVRVTWWVNNTLVTGSAQNVATFTTTPEYIVETNNGTISLIQRTSTTSDPVSSWLPGTSYSSGTVVAYAGLFYISNGALTNITPQEVITSSTNAWVPYWLPWKTYSFGQIAARISLTYSPTTVDSAATYTAGSVRSINGYSVYTVVDQGINSLQSDPANFGLQPLGWIPRVTGTSTQLTLKAGSLVMDTATNKVYLVTLDSYKVVFTSSRFIPTWSGESVSAGGTVIYVDNTINSYDIWRNGGSTVNVTPGNRNTTGADAWVRVRYPGMCVSDDDFYVLNEVVFDKGTGSRFRAYTPCSISVDVENPKNVLTSRSITGWVPEYTSGGNVGDTVFVGSIYYVRVNLLGSSTPSSPNNTGNGWVPVWDSSQTYASGVYVWYNGNVFRSSSAISTPSSITPDVSNVWEPAAWDNSASYAAGSVVFYNGQKYGCLTSINAGVVPASPTSSISAWIPFHSSVTTYNQDTVVLLDYLRAFVLKSTSSVGVIPQVSNTSGTGWVPIWCDADKSVYSVNSYVSDGTKLYIAVTSVSSGLIPNPTNTGTTGWIPIWTTNMGIAYGQVIYYRPHAGMYGALSAPTSEPNGRNTTGTGWAPVWLSAGSYSGAHAAGDYVYHSMRFYIARPGGALTSTPSLTNSSGAGWVQVWSSSISYTENQFVWYVDRCYGAGSNVNANVVPSLTVSTAVSLTWAPIYDASMQYYAGQWAVQSGRFYIAIQPVLGTTPAASTLATSSSTPTNPWIQKWRSGFNFTTNSLVVHNVINNGIRSVFQVFRASSTTAPSGPPTYSASVGYVRGMIVTYSGVQYSCDTNIAPGGVLPGVAGSSWIRAWRAAPTTPYTTDSIVMNGPTGTFTLVGTTDGTNQPDAQFAISVGWITNWVMTDGYFKNRVVLSNNSVYTASKDIAPGSAAPQTNTDWIGSWSASATYTSSSIVSYNGVLYTTLQSQPPNSLPQLRTTSTSEWLPVYNDNTEYSSQLVSYNSNVFYAPQPVAGITPPNSPWIPQWQAGTYNASEVVFHNGVVYSQIGPSNTSIMPASPNTTGTEWMPAWQAGSYNPSQYVAYNNTVYYQVGPSSIADTPTSINTTGTGWLSVWKEGTFNAAQYVIHNGVVYFQAGPSSTTATPVNSNTTGTGWIPVWQAGSYNASQHVVYNGSIYYQHGPSSTSSTPINNTVGATGWVPVWMQGGTYSQGEYVIHNGVIYMAYGSTLLSANAPEFTVLNANGWVPLWISGVALAQGSYVIENGVLHMIANAVTAEDNVNPPSMSSTPAYNSTLTYSTGNVVLDVATGNEFIAVGEIQINTPPSLSVTSLTGWIPVWKQGTSFSVGTYAFYNGQFYKAVSNIANLSSTAPSATITSSDGWVALWQSGVAIQQGSYVLYNNSLYHAVWDVTGSGNVDPPSSSNISGLVPVWESGQTYDQNAVVYDPESDRSFVSATTNNATSIVSNATQLSGWVPLWKYGDSNIVQGSVVFSNGRFFKGKGSNSSVLRTTQPAENNTDPNAWSLLWYANGQFPAANYVVDESDNLFYTEESVSSATSPSTSNTTGYGFLPVWKEGSSFAASYYVHHQGKKYIATGLTSDVPGGNGWLRVWKNGDEYTKGGVVYHEGRSYTAWNDQNSLSTTAPTASTTSLSDWIPLWVSDVSTNINEYVVDGQDVYTAVRGMGAEVNNIRPSEDESAVNWIKLWKPEPAAKNKASWYNGRKYVALSTVTESDVPVLNNKQNAGWAPAFKVDDIPLYEKGDYIVHNSRAFVRYGSSSNVPAVNVTNIEGFVPVWSELDLFAARNYAMHNEVLYWAANDIV